MNLTIWLDKRYLGKPGSNIQYALYLYYVYQMTNSASSSRSTRRSPGQTSALVANHSYGPLHPCTPAHPIYVVQHKQRPAIPSRLNISERQTFGTPADNIDGPTVTYAKVICLWAPAALALFPNSRWPSQKWRRVGSQLDAQSCWLRASLQSGDRNV